MYSLVGARVPKYCLEFTDGLVSYSVCSTEQGAVSRQPDTICQFVLSLNHDTPLTSESTGNQWYLVSMPTGLAGALLSSLAPYPESAADIGTAQARDRASFWSWDCDSESEENSVGGAGGAGLEAGTV
jgi:hypothetical protein